MITVLRRLFWMTLLGGAGYIGWRALQRRNEVVGNAGTPVWPPFDPATADHPPAAETAPDRGAEPAGDGAPAETVANGTADASHRTRSRWLAPVDGRCPDGYPIKANDSSKIFHVPGGRFYERTRPERCYADAADAEADGYRRAKA